MRGRRAGWVLPALAIGVFGLGLYSYQEHQGRMASVLQVENGYQSAFHNMAYSIDEMQDALARVLVSTSPRITESELAAVARFSTSASAYAAGLPASLTHGGSIQSFLNQVTAQAEKYGLRHVDGSRLTVAERTALGKTYADATKLESETRNLQSYILSHPTSFARSAQIALWGKGKGASVGLVSQFDGLDGAAKKMLTEQREPFLGGSADRTHGGYGIADIGPVVNQAQAVARALAFTGETNRKAASAVALGPGYPYRGYLVTIKHAKESPTYAAVSLHRGLVLWMTQRVVSDGVKLDLEDAEARARAYLRNHGFTRFIATRVTENDGNGVFTFAPLTSGVVIYPQTVLVKVNMANGAIVGYDATQYLTNPAPGISLQPRISRAEAVRDISPSYRIEEVRLAVVRDLTLRPLLVYDILGRTDSNTFRVYVDAQTGDQVSVEKLTKDDGDMS